MVYVFERNVYWYAYNSFSSWKRFNWSATFLTYIASVLLCIHYNYHRRRRYWVIQREDVQIVCDHFSCKFFCMVSCPIYQLFGDAKKVPSSIQLQRWCGMELLLVFSQCSRIQRITKPWTLDVFIQIECCNYCDSWGLFYLDIDTSKDKTLMVAALLEIKEASIFSWVSQRIDSLRYTLGDRTCFAWPLTLLHFNNLWWLLYYRSKCWNQKETIHAFVMFIKVLYNYLSRVIEMANNSAMQNWNQKCMKIAIIFVIIFHADLLIP